MEDMVTTHKKSILAAIVYWGIQQSPYNCPANLTNALAAVSARLDEKGIFGEGIESVQSFNYDAVRELVKDLIYNTPEIAIWNISKEEQNAGIADIKDERRANVISGTSRYGNLQESDKSFVDLDALCHNVLKTITESEV